MANKYQTLENGRRKLKEAKSASSGVADAGEVVALDSAGRIDLSMMPVGIAPDVKVAEASEDVSAGAYVNLWNDAGTLKARLADNTNGRDAHGYVKASHLTGEQATIYFEGSNSGLAGLTPGGRCYLGTAGGVIQTPLNEQTESGKLHQFLGVAVDATEINTDIADVIEL